MALHDETVAPNVHGPEELHSHPSAAKYIAIAVILTLITAAEVAVYYVPAIKSRLGVLVPMLVVLAILKFVLVVGYYMHLKFDNKLFTWLFAGGLTAAVATLTGLWALFNGFGG